MEGLERETFAQPFRLAIEASPVGMLMVNRVGTIVLVNAQIERIFRYTREELVGQSIEVLVPERFRGRHPGFRSGFFAAPGARAMGAGRDLYGLRKDGSEVPIEIGLNPLPTPEGDYVLSSVLDITERKSADHDRTRFFELSVDMVCIANAQGRFLRSNPAFSAVLGYSSQELLDRPLLDLVHPDDREATLAELDALAAGARSSEFTNRYRCSDGSYRWLQWRTASEVDGTLHAVARDVTRDRELVEELRHRQAALSASVKERDVLLQEVHHRVKNNLQVIMSLINMQVRQLGDTHSRVALAECQHRIAVIALIHEKLYQSSDRVSVPFSGYARNLADNIVNATGGTAGRVSLQVEADELSLGIDRAIPCGLILNELITNALRHAFPGDRAGTILLELRRQDAGRVSLAVRDDGVGIPAAVEPERSTSLGMQLVATLVAQLDGELQIARDRGTAVRVTFPLEAA
jgi:PAS domain S-box-containing protein